MIDFGIAAMAIALCTGLREGLRLDVLIQHWLLYLVFAFCVVACLYAYGAYRSLLRYASRNILMQIAFASSTAVIPMIVTNYVVHPISTLGVLIVSGVVCASLLAFYRLAWAWVYVNDLKKDRTPIAIYGVGSAGRQLAELLHRGDKYKPVCFVDDSFERSGQYISGMMVYNSAHPSLKDTLRKLQAHEIFVALPSLKQSERVEVYKRLETLGMAVKTVPSLEDITSRRKEITDVRDISISDLIGRDPVAPIPELIEKNIKGKTVLVTGGGGSIGSEICRQAIKFGAAKLVIYEANEFALYQIDQELCEKIVDQSLVPVLGNILDTDHLEHVFAKHQPETVYHTAAYKHVPLVEANPFEGVKTNIFGTKNVAELAVKYQAEQFVLISTDKAVRPTNVMGATKRMAELIVQSITKDNKNTTLCIVRFGNVIGSSGSVIPKFVKQIDEGGPVTVTDERVTRFFMSIPEASELVIQAGALSSKGEVFHLDMGAEIPIVDLAKSLIKLKGFKVSNIMDKDPDSIFINFTGLRPGEKLYEELLITENPLKTRHHKIFKALEPSVLPDNSWTISKLNHLVSSNNLKGLKVFFEEYVDGYKPYSEPNRLGSSILPTPSDIIC